MRQRRLPLGAVASFGGIVSTRSRRARARHRLAGIFGVGGVNVAAPEPVVAAAAATAAAVLVIVRRRGRKARAGDNDQKRRATGLHLKITRVALASQPLRSFVAGLQVAGNSLRHLLFSKILVCVAARRASRGIVGGGGGGIGVGAPPGSVAIRASKSASDCK